MTAFDPLREETWPVLLTVQQVAAIVQTTVSTVNRRVAVGQFRPMPAQDILPRRWRRTDLLRLVHGRAA